MTIVPGGTGARRRRPPVLALVAVAVLVVVALVVVLVVRGGDDPQPGPSPSTPDVAQQQQTTLVAVGASDGSLVGGELLATDDASTSALLVPGPLLVDIAGSGRVAFAQSLQTGEEAPGRAVADLLDVRVDGTVVLPATALSAFVDSVDGLALDVDVPVPVGDQRVPAGDGQVLDGEQVVAFLDLVVADEAPAARMARLDQVVGGVLSALPDADVLDGFDGGLVSTLPDDELVPRLLAARDDLADEAFGATLLPTVQGAVVEDLVALRLDTAATDDVLRQRFSGAVLGDAAGARVLVQNGFGTPGLGEQARDRLVAAGFRYVGGGNAPELGRARTVVALPDDSAESRELGAAVAEALGVGSDSLAVGQDAPTLADLVVILGADFAEVAATGTGSPSGSSAPTATP